jgi:hypothetical protein
VVVGGVGVLLVAAIWAGMFPSLRQMHRISSADR